MTSTSKALSDRSAVKQMIYFPPFYNGHDVDVKLVELVEDEEEMDSLLLRITILSSNVA